MTHDDNLARIQALRDRLPSGPHAHTVAALDHVEDVLTRHAPQPRYLCRACHVENVLPRHAPQPRLTPAVHYVCRACGGVSPCVDYASAITLLDALDGGTEMANDNVMTTEDTLLAYSEWLDSQGLVASDQGEGADTRSHEVLAKQFVSEWEADDNKAVLAGRVGALALAQGQQEACRQALALADDDVRDAEARVRDARDALDGGTDA